MKQKLTIFTMVVLATIFMASPVLAAGSSRTMEVAEATAEPTIISMTGTITALDEGVIDIDVQMTNRAFIQYRGVPLTVYTEESTVYIKWVDMERTYIGWDELVDLFEEFDDLKASINAELIDGQFYARLVQVSQPRIPQ